MAGVALLLAGLAGLAIASPPALERDLSILVGDPHWTNLELSLLPSAGSVEGMIEQAFLPATVLIEESGGFSRPDPPKLSIYGDSWTWNRWSFNGVDITDAYTSGAPALHVPASLLSDVGLRYAETPGNHLGEGVALRSDLAARGTRAKVAVAFPDAGGIFPLGVEVLDTFSVTHPVNRIRPPPDERRRLVQKLDLALSWSESLDRFDAAAAVEVSGGARRFLAFEPVTAGLAGTFDESFLIVDGALLLHPKGSEYTLSLLFEYLSRDHFFDELGYTPEQTARLGSIAVSAAITSPTLSAGLTLRGFDLLPNRLGFTKELLDRYGPGNDPWYAGGSWFTGNADVTWRPAPFYVSANHRFAFFDPAATDWSNPLTFESRPYGRVDWTAGAAAELIGEGRAGISDRAESGIVALDYDLFVSASYGLNRRLENTIATAGPGLRAKLSVRANDDVTPFVALAKTPLPLTPELIRTLDPDYLNAKLFVGDELIDTFGGSAIRLAPGLGESSAYAAAVGIAARAAGWDFGFQALGKLYTGTYRIAFDGPAASYGRTVDGVFFDDPGPNAYLLENTRDDAGIPSYLGFHFQVARHETERWLLNLGFSFYAAVGSPPPGNGAGANDLGVVDFSSASPNARINAFANLDGDRMYILKALLGWQPIDGLWGLMAIHFRDGRPFAFIDARQDRGQVALIQSSQRGSPYDPPPLAGPRADFQLNVDVKLQYTSEIAGRPLTAAVICTNLLDLGSELDEIVYRDIGPGRSALELQLPRAIFASAELSL